MRSPSGVLLCCLLLAGCRTAEPRLASPPCPAPEVTAEPRQVTSAKTAEPEPDPRERLDRMGESVAFRFFNFTEQAGKVAVLPFQAALFGLYFLLFPLIGFGPGGPG